MRQRIETTADLIKIVERRRRVVGQSQRALSVEAGLSHATYNHHLASDGGEMSLRAALRYIDKLGLRMDVCKRKGA